MKSFLETFFKGLGIEYTTLDVRQESEDLFVRIETTDSPLLIGIHGKNIESFQHIIGRIAEKKLGKFIHVHLEVNDYMKSKDDRLFHFLEGKISWIMKNGKPIQIRNLSSFERKKAHNYIAEKKIEGLKTKSEGLGEERMLILEYTGPIITEDASLVRSSPKNTKSSNDDLSLLSEDGVGI